MAIQGNEDFRLGARIPWVLAILVVVAIATAYVLVRRHRSRAEVATAPTATAPAAPVVQVAVAPPVNTNALQTAISLETAGNLVSARVAYEALLGSTSDARVGREIENRLGRINVSLIFGSGAMPEKKSYVIQKGELRATGKDFRVGLSQARSRQPAVHRPSRPLRPDAGGDSARPRVLRRLPAHPTGKRAYVHRQGGDAIA
jgi:hypothetical protein